MSVETIDVFKKDPNGIEPFTVDWAPFLAKVGNPTIETSVWEVPEGITKVSDNVVGAKATILLSGGDELGARYDLVNRITTSAGSVFDWTIGVLIGEK